MSTEKRTSGATNVAANNETTGLADASSDAKVHLLDIGSGSGHQYGDCLLCQFGEVSVLIDGGHRGDEELVMSQLRQLLNQNSPVRVSLIIITHPHDDHIGCLPSLVDQGLLKADWALVCDPQYRWGNPGDTDAEFTGRDERMRGILEATLEHDRTDLDDETLAGFIDSMPNLETRYRTMLDQLRGSGTVVLHGTDAAAEADLVNAFSGVGLEVLGPSVEHLRECFRLLTEGQTDAIRAFDSTLDFDFNSPTTVANTYRALVEGGVTDAVPRNRGAVNLQSLVTSFNYLDQHFIFAGDMQFADPQVDSQMLIDGVEDMRASIRRGAPYAFAKLSHHGSDNAFDEVTMADYGDTVLYGICCGNSPGHHPNPVVLQLLKRNRQTIDWVRTDRNGLVSITFRPGAPPDIKLTRGRKDDSTPPRPPRPAPFADTALVAAAAPTPGSAQLFVESSGGGGSNFTFSTTVPANATRLAVTLDLQPNSAQPSPSMLSVTTDADVSPQVYRASDPVPREELTPNSADDVESEPGSSSSLNIDANCDVDWRPAKSILKLRSQVNVRAPHRNKASDGTIGDKAHCQRNSDHNPWVRDGSIGVVTAIDITNDPAGGCDANTIAEAIRASRDPRVKYIIWNRRIANSSAMGNSQPWQWRPYHGTNPHTKHVHISVKPDKSSYDSTVDWAI
jgi:beta-lactamase superfamily II metal-dependent hydrolase